MSYSSFVKICLSTHVLCFKTVDIRVILIFEATNATWKHDLLIIKKHPWNETQRIFGCWKKVRHLLHLERELCACFNIEADYVFSLSYWKRYDGWVIDRDLTLPSLRSRLFNCGYRFRDNALLYFLLICVFIQKISFDFLSSLSSNFVYSVL